MSDPVKEPSLPAVAAMVSVGFIPLNLLPFTVVGYASGLNLGTVDASLLGTTEMSGAMFGSLAAIPLVKRMPLRRVALIATLAAALFEGLSCLMHSFAGMSVARLLVGMACGTVLASGNAIAAAAFDPARYYMRVLALQSALTIFIWSAMPKLLAVGGQYGVFGGSAFALLALALVMLANGAHHADIPASSTPTTQISVNTRSEHGRAGVIAIALLAVFACCMRDGVAWTFSDRIAIEVGLSDMGQTLLYAGIGALGLVVLLTSARLDIWKRPIANVAGAIILASATTTGLLFSHHWLIFVALALPWAAAQFLALSFLTGLSSELDPSGRLSAATGAAFQCAYAVAPALAGLVFAQLGYVAVGALATGLSFITLVAGCWLASRAVDHRRREAPSGV